MASPSPSTPKINRVLPEGFELSANGQVAGRDVALDPKRSGFPECQHDWRIYTTQDAWPLICVVCGARGQ